MGKTEEKPVVTGTLGRFRAIDFRLRKEDMGSWRDYFKALWGFDVFMNDVPILKVIILANIIVWLVLFQGE